MYASKTNYFHQKLRKFVCECLMRFKSLKSSLGETGRISNGEGNSHLITDNVSKSVPSIFRFKQKD